MKKGICYDIGSYYNQASPLRNGLEDYLGDELDLIKAAGFNSISLYGTKLDFLIKAAQEALKKDFFVLTSPRFIDCSLENYLESLKDFSSKLERVAEKRGDLVLALGNELTAETKIFFKDPDYSDRFKKTAYLNGSADHRGIKKKLNQRLNRLLKESLSIASSTFSGKISYLAADWEDVDWSLFSLICLNRYFNQHNKKSYFNHLKKLKKEFDKPLLVTEFGVPTFEGGANYGGAAWLMARSGQVAYSQDYQAQQVLTQLRRILKHQDIIDGFFIYSFLEPKNGLINPTSLSESYGLMEYYLDDEISPKKSFLEVSKLLKSLNQQ